MAQKRSQSSQSSPFYIFEDFSTQEQDNNLNWYYADIELHISQYLDGELFKDFSFTEAFNFVDLKKFVFEKLQERYNELVIMFYANLTY